MSTPGLHSPSYEGQTVLTEQQSSSVLRGQCLWRSAPSLHLAFHVHTLAMQAALYYQWTPPPHHSPTGLSSPINTPCGLLCTPGPTAWRRQKVKGLVLTRFHIQPPSHQKCPPPATGGEVLASHNGTAYLIPTLLLRAACHHNIHASLTLEMPVE